MTINIKRIQARSTGDSDVKRSAEIDPMQTVRKQIMALLSEAECSAKDISQVVRISEKEVFEHLDHIRQSLAARNQKLILKPASCMECGYVFQDRRRVTKPGRCPRCKGEHIEDPRYRIQ